MAGGPLSQSSLPKDLPSLDPQLGKRIKIFLYAPILIVITNMVIIIAENTGVAQVKEPVASTNTEDNTLQTSTGEPSTVKSIPAVVISEAATVTIPEVSVTTSASKELAAGHVPTLSETIFASTEIVRTIIKRGSGSASIELAPAMDIIEELAHQMK